MGCSLRRKFVDFWCPFFQKNPPREIGFLGPSILTPKSSNLDWVSNSRPKVTFHQVHKSGYSEGPPRQPANRILQLHGTHRKPKVRVGLEIPFIHVTN